ncbi:MAG: hypothetical protein ACC667_01030 [Longimicrobiales bacterium]
MSADHPSWQPFDPIAGSVPEALGALAAGGGDPRVIALLRMPGIDSWWGAEAAVGIARAWGESGDAVLLSDLDLRDPKLHEVLGHENGQGVSDILLYGVSVQHAAFASEMGSFLVVTAGTPVADPEAVLAHPRWEAVTRGLRETGATVLLHLPADLPGASSVLSRADHVVVFAADASGAEGVEGAIAVLGPLVEEPAGALDVDEPETVEEPATVEEPVDMDEPPVVDESVGFEYPDEVLDTPEPVDEPVESIDVAEEISDAVIEAVTDEYDESADQAVEEPEAAEEEVLEPLVDADAPGEPPGKEPALVEEATPGSTEGGFGDFTLDEPAAPAEEAEVGGGEYDFDGLDGGQYTHVDGAPSGDEESSSFDATGLDDMAPEEPEVEVTPMEGIETMDRVEPISDDGDSAHDESAAEEPSFDIGEGLELEAPEISVDPPAPDPEPTPADADDPFEGLGSGGGVFDVERSSLAADVAAPDDTTMMSGIERGGDMADEAPYAPDLEAGDIDVVDAATEAMRVETPAVPEEPEPESEAYDSAEFGEDTDEVEDDGELQVQPERKMSGLDKLASRRKWQERRRVLLTTVAAIVVLGGGGWGLAFLGIVDVPGITPASRLSSAIPAPVRLDGEQPTTQIVSHSLLINLYRTPETPRAMVPTLAERLPGTLFFYTPMEMDERVQYVLFAGAAYSAVQADSLKLPLAAVLDRQNPDDWRVRATPYAFFFGEYSGAAGVAARIEELAALAIPAYALDVDYADGRTAVRVYAGAFSDEFDAQPLAAVISESGMSGIPLIERRGRLPE